jgi:serine phosphatase RsbU (regulator of sigma subunit)
VLIHDDQIINIKADNIPIGYYESLGKFSLHEIDIEKNDTIYMFSDGIIDQFGGPVNRRFMIKQLKEIFFANHKKGMFQQKEILMNEIALWKGDLVQTDDIMVMGIRF